MTDDTPDTPPPASAEPASATILPFPGGGGGEAPKTLADVAARHASRVEVRQLTQLIVYDAVTGAIVSLALSGAGIAALREALGKLPA